MRAVDCTCDAGADGNGICGECLGVGWYLTDEFDPIAWVIAWGVN